MNAVDPHLVSMFTFFWAFWNAWDTVHGSSMQKCICNVICILIFHQRHQHRHRQYHHSVMASPKYI